MHILHIIYSFIYSNFMQRLAWKIFKAFALSVLDGWGEKPFRILYLLLPGPTRIRLLVI